MHDSQPVTPQTISGLGPGTMLLTMEGEMPVEWIAPGDRLITRDHGAQPILHIARLRKAPDGSALPVPMTFEPGERGPQGELREKLRVAPGHRGLLRRPEIQLNFGTEEALARFADISRRDRSRPDPRMGGLTYHLIIMERHELITAGSLWVETTDAEMAAQLDLPPAVLRATQLFDEGAKTARRVLTREEAMLIRRECPPGLSLLDLLAA